MKTLLEMRNQVSDVIDLDFVINIGKTDVTLEDWQIAETIKGANYQKTKKKLNELIERCNQTLNDFENRVQQSKDQYETLLSQAHAQEPGKPPSSTWVNNSDPNSVARYNEKASMYNNQLDLFRRLMDKANRAKERFEDALEKYNEKKADLKEQVNLKSEELEPALEQDIIVFLDNMLDKVNTQMHDQSNVFMSFMFIYITKKVYLSLSDKVTSANGRRATIDAMKKLEEELDRISLNYVEKIKEGLIDAAGYLHTCFKENESIFQNIKNELSTLPYNDCQENEEEILGLTSLPAETKFEYKKIIAPDELAQIEQQVRERKLEFEKNIKHIEKFNENMKSIFDEIAQVKSNCYNNLSQMEKNKNTKLGKLFLDIPFTLNVLEEPEQDEHLKKHKKWLGEIEQEINKKFEVEVYAFKEKVVYTDMLTKSARELLFADKGLNFLSFRDNLAKKRQLFVESIQILEAHMDGINRLPQENSEEVKKKMNSCLNISLLPLGNLGVLFSIKDSIKKFLPALSSSNSCYISLRETLIKKFQIFMFVHLSIIIACGAVSFFFEKQQKLIVYGLALIYGISGLAIFLYMNQLRKCRSLIHAIKNE